MKEIMSREEEEHRQRMAIKLFSDMMSNIVKSAMPVEEDLEGARNLIDKIHNAAEPISKDPKIDFFGRNLLCLCMIAEVGLGALTALYKMQKIEELKTRILKADKCIVVEGCIFKLGHNGDCITNL